MFSTSILRAAPKQLKPRPRLPLLPKLKPSTSHRQSPTSTPPSQHLVSRTATLNQLRGQTIRIPNLHHIFRHTLPPPNPHLASIDATIKDIIQSAPSPLTPTVLAKLQSQDLRAVIATWFPNATKEALRPLTYFCAWMLLTDDQLDACAGPGGDSPARFRALCGQAGDFAGKCLEGEPAESSQYFHIDLFRGLARSLRKTCSEPQIRRFGDEVKLTIDSYLVEQEYRVAGEIPSVEQYAGYRVGSSCMGLNVAMIEFANGLRLPDKVMEDEDMKQLRLESIRTAWITNDIVSAKKEIHQGFVENLVCLYATDGKAQTGVDKAIDLIQGSADAFETAASRLSKRYQVEAAISKDLVTFVAGCRDIFVGSYEWGQWSQRCGIAGEKRDAERAIIMEL